MNNILDIITLIFYGPFLWMLLLSYLLGRALKHKLESDSLPYAPYIDEVDNGALMRHTISCMAVGIVLLIISYYLDVALPADRLMIFWFVVVGVQLVGASSSAIYLGAALSALIYLIMGDAGMGRSLATIAGLYQIGYGVLLLVGIPKTYPIIGQESDDRLVGKQIYARIFIMPILGFRAGGDQILWASLMMLLIFIYTKRELIGQTVQQFTMRQGIYHLISGAVVLAMVFIAVPIYVVFGAMVAMAVGWLIHDRMWCNKQSDLYVIPSKSLCVLYVRHGSVGHQMGLRPADRIMTVNGDIMIRPEAMDAFLVQYPPYIWLEVEREGKKITMEYKDYQEGIGDLGVVFMPREIVKYKLYKKRRWLW